MPVEEVSSYSTLSFAFLRSLCLTFRGNCYIHHYYQNFDQVGCYECKCTIGELEFIAEGHTKPDAKVVVVLCLLSSQFKTKTLIPRFTLLRWQFKDSSLRSESVHECQNHWYSKMFLRCELNETEGVGNRLRASNLSYEKKTDMLFFVFFAVLNLKTFSEDNCPWAAIASLALHKLFTDWQSQGYTLPKVFSKL